MIVCKNVKMQKNALSFLILFFVILNFWRKILCNLPFVHLDEGVCGDAASGDAIVAKADKKFKIKDLFKNSGNFIFLCICTKCIKMATVFAPSIDNIHNACYNIVIAKHITCSTLHMHKLLTSCTRQVLV